MPTTRAAEKMAQGGEGKGEANGSKHRSEGRISPEPKRAKKDDNKEQQTIEDVMPTPTEAYGKYGAPQISQDEPETSTAVKEESVQIPEEKTDTAVKPDAREGKVPAGILEKGVIYFFFRGRVGIDEPGDVGEIQRSYMILRPIDKEAKLEEGTVEDSGNNRLIAVPKKVFPRSGKERWIAFVEKAKVSLDTIKEQFLASYDYETKTVGTRHTPAATPAAEGIYAITTTGRESHLAYMITLPSELGELQTELGLREKGSFIISTRNPQYDAPRGTALPKGPEYPKSVQDEFRARRWMPSRPHHLDYANTQFLLIGESSGIKKATEPRKEDEEEGKEMPIEELVKLEDEDTHRMEDLRGDDSVVIFADLSALAEDYPKLKLAF